MPDDDVIPPEDQKGDDSILTHCKIPYIGFSLFKETGEILLFNKRKYKVSFPVGIMINKMHPSVISATQFQVQTSSEKTLLGQTASELYQ